MATTFRKSTGREYFESIVIAVILALFIRTFVVQAFKIPTGSMENNLLVGDHLLVNKFVFAPTASRLEGMLLPIDPIQRGDVVVFKYPEEPERDFIKRVIGLPGDRIQVVRGVLQINGQAVTRERIDDYQTVNPFGRTKAALRYHETLPGGVRHEIIELDGDNGTWDNTELYVVPAGHYFMMGDNRDNSTDSRALSDVGFVPFENFVGRAEIIFFSIAEDASFWQVWQWPWSVRWGRLFQPIR
jgi:signal peptidase I